MADDEAPASSEKKILTTISYCPEMGIYHYVRAVGEGLRPEGRAEGSLRPEGRAEGSLRPEGRAEGSLRPEGRAEGSLRPEGRAEGSLRYEEYFFTNEKLVAQVDEYLKGDDQRQAEFMAQLTAFARQFPHKVVSFDAEGKVNLGELIPPESFDGPDESEPAE